jgi:hypothetical protein
MESQTIELPLSEGEVWRITNIYIPSERAGDSRNSPKETVVSTKHWPKGRSDMIAGDFNAHHSRWDRQLNRVENRRGLDTKRGEMIEEWIQNTDMRPLNDTTSGKNTHTNRKTARESCPDITIINALEREHYDNWQVMEELGGSDHKPIIFRRYVQGLAKVNVGENHKWDFANGDMDGFRDQMEAELPRNYDKKSVYKIERIWQRQCKKVGNKTVKKKRMTAASTPKMNEEIKKEIKQRDKDRAETKQTMAGKAKWIKQCTKVKGLVMEEKRKRWKEFVDQLDSVTNPREVYRTIRNLDGRFVPRRDNEVLVIGGKGIIDDVGKANAFAKTCKTVSIIPRNKQDRIIKRANRKFLQERPKQKDKQAEECKITMSELNNAIDDSKKNKAPGEDDIPYEFYKKLGSRARRFLLCMYNKIWAGEPIPQR